MSEETISTAEKELLVAFKEAKDRKEILTKQKTDAENAFESAKYKLIEYLTERGQKATAKYEGIGHVTMLSPEIRARVLKEDEERLFEFLRENKYDGVIKPTVHHSTLSSVIGEMLRSGIELPEFVKTDEVRTVKFFVST